MEWHFLPEPCLLLSRICLCLQDGRSLVCQPRTSLKDLCCLLVFLRKDCAADFHWRKWYLSIDINRKTELGLRIYQSNLRAKTFQGNCRVFEFWTFSKWKYFKKLKCMLRDGNTQYNLTVIYAKTTDVCSVEIMLYVCNSKLTSYWLHSVPDFCQGSTVNVKLKWVIQHKYVKEFNVKHYFKMFNENKYRLQNLEFSGWKTTSLPHLQKGKTLSHFLS